MADNDEFDESEVEIDLDAFEDDTVGDEPDLDFGLTAEEPTDEELSVADLFGTDGAATTAAEPQTGAETSAAAESVDEESLGEVSEVSSDEEPAGQSVEEREQDVTAPSAPARGLDDDFEINLNFDADQEEETTAAPVMDFDAETAVATAMADLRTDLDSKFGDWYVVHTYAGMENRVKQNIEQRVTSLNMEDYIYETVVPTETVVEMKNGNKKEVTRVYLPGYVLVRMDLTDESWGCIRHTPAVTGFVGNANDPTPLTLDEVENMMRPSVVARVAASAVGKGKRPAKKVEVQDYQIGDSIMVIEGPFAGVPGIITEINPNTQRLIATVEFMGRDTPVDLTFPQIQKS
ncbi:transcription termination/antitermination protein NusG [Raineyella sp.]|uniref:transcription termination/antitermination protein NusG n=1 Tax=Raineyella sp. TaxID=1911550 RepID=UPI003A52100F